MAKIGLIAPFEGLYRETGYAALDALRQAISDCAPASVELVPLALDDSSQPFAASRSARKMVADPAVVAIVGPYGLNTVEAVTPHLRQIEPVWIVPAAVSANGEFAEITDSPGWLADLTVEIVRRAANEGASSATVGGVPAAWIPSIQTAVSDPGIPIPVKIVDEDFDYNHIEPLSAMVWLGQPHLGARLANHLQDEQPDAAFWMGPEGGNPVFSAHGESSGERYWVSWVTPQYNPDVQPAPGALTSQLTYAATCHALVELYGSPEMDLQPLHIQAFRVDADGNASLLGEH